MKLGAKNPAEASQRGWESGCRNHMPSRLPTGKIDPFQSTATRCTAWCVCVESWNAQLSSVGLGDAHDLLGSVQPAQSPSCQQFYTSISGSPGLWKSQQLTRGLRIFWAQEQNGTGCSVPCSLPCYEFCNPRPAFKGEKEIRIADLALKVRWINMVIYHTMGRDLVNQGKLYLIRAYVCPALLEAVYVLSLNP